jgi:hypothetical protein
MPYHKNKERNEYCEPYSSEQEYATRDPKEGCSAISSDVTYLHKGLAVADVKWNYHGTEIDLEFKAGFIGASQDAKTKKIRPIVGWYMTEA